MRAQAESLWSTVPGDAQCRWGPGSQGSLPQRGTHGLCRLHWLRPGRALETSQATASEMSLTTTPGLLMCPSCRGLPSQAFEYILYNKGIMGEDTYPYRGRVTTGGRSRVPSRPHFTLIPLHPAAIQIWPLHGVACARCSYQGPLVTPASVTPSVFPECPSSGPSHLNSACLVPS